MNQTNNIKNIFKILKLKYFKRSSVLRRSSSTAHTVQNFAENTTIHGIRFLTKSQNNNFVRVFWIISLITSLILLTWNAGRLYNKLNVQPDVAIAEKQGFSRNIPFPAVTICLPVFAKNRLANHSYYMNEYNANGMTNLLNLTEEERKYLLINTIRCIPTNLDPIQDCCKDSNISNAIELMYKSSLNVDEAFSKCSLMFNPENCTDMVHKILTDRGFCFTTNMQDLNTIFKTEELDADFKTFIKEPSVNSYNNDAFWTLDGGYKNYSESLAIPRRLNKQNIHSFNLFLKQEDVYNVCNSKNIFIRIHLPNEIPTLFHRQYMQELKHTQKITINAKVIKAHPSLKNYSPKARRCYFSGERLLQFFRIYTKYHCFLECMTNYILNKCGCVDFYMPRNSSTEVCNLDRKACVLKNVFKWPNHEGLGEETTPCSCYPTCNDIEYSAIVLDSEYRTSVHGKFNSNDSDEFYYAFLNIDFKDHEVQIFEKYASYKLQDFIADLGGLLGFFLGCSLLSLIEVFYFIFMAIHERCLKRNVKDVITSNKSNGHANHEIFNSLNPIGNNVFIVRSPLYQRENRILSEA